MNTTTLTGRKMREKQRYENVCVLSYISNNKHPPFTLVSPILFSSLFPISHLLSTSFYLFPSYFWREVWQPTPRFAQFAVPISMSKTITHGAHYTSKRELCLLSVCCPPLVGGSPHTCQNDTPSCVEPFQPTFAFIIITVAIVSLLHLSWCICFISIIIDDNPYYACFLHTIMHQQQPHIAHSLLTSIHDHKL